MKSRMMAAVTALALAVAAAACTTAVPGARAEKAPELSGEWRLDRAATRELRQEERAGERAGRRDADRVRRGERRGERRGPAGEGMARDWRPGERGRGMLERLRIEQSGSVITVCDSAGRAMQEIVLGGRAGETGVRRGEPRRLAGRIAGGRLEAEFRGPRGGTVTETYVVSEDGQRLEVRVRRTAPEGGERPGRGREMVRVYRRVGGA